MSSNFFTILYYFTHFFAAPLSISLQFCAVRCTMAKTRRAGTCLPHLAPAVCSQPGQHRCILVTPHTSAFRVKHCLEVWHGIRLKCSIIQKYYLRFGLAAAAPRLFVSALELCAIAFIKEPPMNVNHAAADFVEQTAVFCHPEMETDLTSKRCARQQSACSATFLYYRMNAMLTQKGVTASMNCTWRPKRPNQRCAVI